MKKQFSGFPNHRLSGLLKETMTRLDNGGLSTAQLQVLLTGGNPNNRITWATQEWLNFFDDLFNVTVSLEGYWYKYKNDVVGVKFHIENSGQYPIVLPEPRNLPLELIIRKWNEKVASAMTISLEGMKNVNLAEITDRYTNIYGIRSLYLQVPDDKTDAMKQIKMESTENGVGGSTLRGILLFLMFLFWKHGTIDPIKHLAHTKQKVRKGLDTYMFPCGEARFPGEIDSSNPLCPIVMLRDQSMISIHVRGAKELIENYKPGCVIGF